MAPGPRPSVAALTGYEWEESSESIAARLGVAVGDVVRFDTNTVPWKLPLDVPPVGSFAVNEYPDSTYASLVSAISAYSAQPPSSIVVGAGADELITLVAQAYLDDMRLFLLSDPTYSLFDVASSIAGATPIVVDSGECFALDRAAFTAAAADAHVTWIANPNNPTGELLPQEFLRELAQSTGGMVVVDEAYAEFCDGSALSWIADAPNVLVIRTLSKAFGLAGMRVGYLVAAPDVVATLNKLRPPGSITVVSAHMAASALNHAADMRTRVRTIVTERHGLATALTATGRTVIEGSANFVLVHLDAADVDRALAHGLVMRTFPDGHRLHGWCRITVRSPEENARLLGVL